MLVCLVLPWLVIYCCGLATFFLAPRVQVTILLLFILLLCFITACAFASSRTNLDGSSFAFNLFCVKPLVTTWLVKSAYGLEQDIVGDCLKLYCCFSCCLANQIYQTTLKRKNPTHDGGVLHNTQPLPTTWCPPTWGYLCGALLCGNCVMASSLQEHVGMPWCFGCLCAGPFAG